MPSKAEVVFNAMAGCDRCGHPLGMHGKAVCYATLRCECHAYGDLQSSPGTEDWFRSHVDSHAWNAHTGLIGGKLVR